MKFRLSRIYAVAMAFIATTASIGRAQPIDWAQGPALGSGLSDSAGLSGLPSENVPLPLGNPGNHGFFTFFEATYLTQTWTLGSQTVANRGLLDSTGRLTGTPGQLIGSGAEALNTGDFGRRTFVPGYTIGIGYKLDDDTSFTARYSRNPRYMYTAGATLVPRLFRGGLDLADTFLWAPVYNFPPAYAGAATRTGQEGVAGLPSQLFYGIWNGASVMTIDYTQEFTDADIGVRIPLFATETSKVSGLAGGHFDWFYERFRWRSQVFDVNSQSLPTDIARYQNILSQRMYGPYLGASHEVYLGKRFSLSTDVTGALLLNIIKERATYKLETDTMQNKRSLTEIDLSPSVSGNVNLWMYPLSGVQMRVGYNINMFFNTKRMEQPIGFNYSSIDPVYSTQYFRMIHGLNVGFGLFF